MKKLMIALASAATAVFAFGEDVLPHGADFENANYTAGENFTNYVNKADDGAATSGNRYWYSTSEDIGVISNHQSGISVKSVPDLYENATPTGGVKYLQLDTQTRLFRTIANNDQSGSFTGVDMSTGDGVYLDTLVKFTAADAAFGTDALEEADKIAIEYVEREIEYGTGDEAAVVKVTPLTNFVVRAGFIGSAFATNYLVDVPDGWLENNMKDDWHRLTVRALTNIDGNNRAGFKIYLDEVPLVYRTDKDEFAQSAGFEDDTHMIFPSAVASGVNKTTISAVAFSGNGSIDDVVFTTTKPKFIAESEAVVVPFVADAGVTAISVLPDGATDAILVDMTADTLSAQLPAQTTAFTVTATIDTANGYEFVSMTVGDAVYNTNPASVTGYAGGNITITAARNNVTYIDDNDQQQSCPSLATAFANAKSGTTITLAYGVDAADTEDVDFEGYTISGKSVVLDLNGQTITWNDPEGTGQSLFNILTGAELMVKDSSVPNTGKIVYGGEYGAFYNSGVCYVGAASGDNGPTIEGILYNVGDDCGPQIVRGKFDKVSNSTEDETPTFIGAAVYIEAGSELKESLGDYWVVAPKGGSEPTEIAVPTAKTDLVYDGTEKIGVVVGTGYTLTGNIATNAGNYTATATLEAGYVWSDTTTEAKSISWSIAPKTDAEVVVTLTSEIAEYSAQLEFPTASATIGGDDVAGTPAWDPTTISEPEAGATNTYTVTFTVTTANYVGSFGTATFKVWKAESEEPVYPSYIDGDDAAAKGKYDAWKSYVEGASETVDDGETLKDAYLLNCKPSEVAAAKAAFKFTSISYDATEQKWVATTTTSYNDREFNGTVTVKQYSDVGCTTESETGTFFKAVLQ